MENNKLVITNSYTPQHYTVSVEVEMNNEGLNIFSEARYDAFFTKISPEDAIKIAELITNYYKEK